MTYKERMIEDIRACLEATEVQPILFVGSGLSQRYCGLPNWQGLMEILVELCPKFSRKFAFYEQSHARDYKSMASDFASVYADWAWDTVGRNSAFNDSLFKAGIPSDIYLKTVVSDFFKNRTQSIDLTQSPMYCEIQALQKIKPHALITTNYDLILEKNLLIIKV